MSIELSLNTVTFGKMKMIVPYHYHDHSLYQNSFYFWSGDIPGKNYFIYPENAVIYKRLGSSADSETYELSAGSKLYVIGYWFKEGLIWVHVANEDHIGWMPLISENTSINLFDYSNEEVDKWVAENSEKSYFDNSIVFPDLEEVQQSGLQLLQEGINTDISSDLYKLEEALLILDIGEKSKELQTETEDMVNQIKSSDEYSAIWDILESLMDEGSFDELYIHLLGLSYLLDDEEKYQTYLDICLDHLFSVSSDSDNGQITQEAEYSKTAWSALVEQLIVRFGKEEELAYAEADFDHDQVNEVVIRRRDSEVPGE